MSAIAQLSINPLNKDTDSQELAAQWIGTHSEKGFIENRGQMMDMNGEPAPFVLFKTEAPGLNLWITESGMVMQTLRLRKELIPESELTDSDKLEINRTGKPKTKKFRDWERIDLELKGATVKRENIIKEGEGRTDFNFFYGHCPDGIYGVKEYEKITIKNVYPNIDWVIHRTFSPRSLSNESGKAEQGEIKYDFIVHPGADHKQIELLYRSKEPIIISEQGRLEFYTDYGNLSENTPVSFYQDKVIETKFHLNYQKAIEINGGSGYETSVAFDLNGVDSELTTDLIIDPQIQWATFYGGNDLDGPQSVTTDSNGNVFVAGYTGSSDFPALAPGTNGYFQGAIASGGNAMILKFNNTGVRLWATYYGGNVGDTGYSIATDNSGNVFVTGWTRSLDFPTQDAGGGAYFQGAFGLGFNDAFILKFNNDGVRLWATYYGGSGFDFGYSIATDANGNVFVSGETRSTDFPTMNPGSGAFFQGTYGQGDGDAFILKFTNDGVRLWATYYGGNGIDMGYAITTDVGGNVLLTGQTASTNFPTHASGAGDYNQIWFAGGDADAFILKFSNTGVRQWATYYGGAGDDFGYSIATDASSNVFVTGQTRSSDFPVLNPDAGAYFQGASGGWKDVFILKFNDTSARLWATYYGGAKNERQGTYDNLAIDACGNVYMSFHTTSTTLPFEAPCDGGYFDDSFNGGGTANSGDWPHGGDIGIVLFSNSGIMRWSTLVSGNGEDVREALALDSDNNLFLTGEWTEWGSTTILSSTYPLMDSGGGAYYDSTFNGGNDDGFMMKFSHNPISVNVSIGQPTCGNPCDGSATVSVDGSCSFTCLWSDGQTASTGVGLCAGVTSVAVYNEFCSDTTVEVTLTNPSAYTVSTSTTDAACGNNDGTATATVIGGTAPYTFNWMPGNLSGDVQNNLAAGIYTLTVQDANGCEATTQTSVTNPNAPEITLISQTNVSCFDGNTGSATVEVIGDHPPFSYSWSPFGGDSSTANGLLAGDYTVTVIDTDNCSSSLQVTIAHAAPQLIVTTSTTNSNCMDNTGTATANCTGGVEPYSYSWVPGNLNGAFQSNLVSGTYSVTVTDATGCQANAQSTVDLTNQFSLEILFQNDVTCIGVADGSVMISASGGQAPYSYVWTPNGGNDAIANDLSVGTYNVSVTDANDCQVDTSIVIGVEAEFHISISLVGNTLTSSGGAINYQWYLNGQTIPGANGPSHIMTESGNYYLLATDVNGCENVSETIEATYIGLNEAIIGNVVVTFDSNGGFARIYGNRPIAALEKWVLLDVSGRQLIQGSINSSEPLYIHLPLDGVSSGLYIVSLIGKEFHAVVKMVWLK